VKNDGLICGSVAAFENKTPPPSVHLCNSVQFSLLQNIAIKKFDFYFIVYTAFYIMLSVCISV